MALVNFYAAARQAAGSSSQKIPAGNLGGLVDQLVAMNGEMAKLIPTCSFLINGSASEGHDQILVEGDVVDVLPQFAGG